MRPQLRLIRRNPVMIYLLCLFGPFSQRKDNASPAQNAKDHNTRHRVRGRRIVGGKDAAVGGHEDGIGFFGGDVVGFAVKGKS